jgi:DHA3 family tetracycline resistance protein-like MFS transporter
MARLSAPGAFLLNTALTSLFRGIIFTGLSLYYVREAGLNPFQLVLVGTAVESACFLFEVPTGVVADVYSRRLSVLIGSLLIGLAYVLTGALPLFTAIIAAEIIRGLGETFISGAQEAWLTDEVGAAHVGGLLARGLRYSMLVSLLGGGISVLLATRIGGGATILLGGLGLIFTMGLMTLLMPEKNFARVQSVHEHGIFGGARQAITTFRDGTRAVRGSPVLTLLIVIGFILGASTEGFDRLWESHLLTSFALPQMSLPVLGTLDVIVWFFLLDAVFTLISISLLKVLEARLEQMNSDSANTRILLLLGGTRMVANLLFALAGSVWLAMAAYLAGGAARALSWPVNANWRNRNIPSAVRATVISMHSQADALGQITGGPGVGQVGVVFGVRAAIALASALIAPALALYARGLRKPDT